MRVRIIQHVAHEGPGSVVAWCAERAAEVAYSRLWESTVLPGIDDFDVLVVLGGPMSVNDEATLPWLTAEKQLIADAVAAGRSVLGICLGAQLIAAALGAKVYVNAEPEIGWHVVRAVSGPATPFSWPRRLVVFHWHGETFDLPPKATLLASSFACFHQAFCVGQRVVGLQFHPEATRDSVAALVTAGGHDLPAGDFVQSPAAMLAGSDEAYEQGQQLLRSVLETIVSATDQTV